LVLPEVETNVKIIIKPYNGTRLGRLADASVEFTDGFLDGFQLIGFAINERGEELYVDFPAYVRKDQAPFFFLRPDPERAEELLDKVQNAILDCYEKTARAVREEKEFVL
jgi:hypothetical protein